MQATHYQSDSGEHQDPEGNKVIVICGDEVHPAAGLDVVVEETESEAAYLEKYNLTKIEEDENLHRRGV